MAYTHADDTESTTTASFTPPDLFTPATEPEQDVQIKLWLELARAVADNNTHDPSPGETLILVDKTYGRVLACHPGGHLTLDNINEYDMNQPIPKRWKWRCAEKDNFIGFCNLAEDRFLGHDIWWTFSAQAPVQRGWEHFVLVKRQNGYFIQSPFWWAFRPLSARSDGAGIEVGQPDGGTLWGFIQANE